MSNKYFNYSDVLGYGWSVMKANLGFFIGLGFLFLIISFLPAIAEQVVRIINLPQALESALSILLQILGWVISIVLGIGLIKIALTFCDERKPNIRMLFDAFDCFWRYVGAMILYTLIMLAGFLLFIVPGIIWAVKFSLCYYFVIDKGFGPVQALKASSRATMGVKWQLFGFGIFCVLINFLGLICLIVGIFATYPTIIVATALVYRQLLAQTSELDEFGIGTIAAGPETGSSVEPGIGPSIEPEPESFRNWRGH